MAKFTESQKNACTIIKTEHMSYDGTFYRWFFEVEDSNGESYSWTDGNLNSTASKVEVKTAIGNHLMNKVDKIEAKPVLTINQITNKGEGETLG